MPERRVEAEVAGKRDITLALQLALGDFPVTSYRVDRDPKEGDTLWLATDELKWVSWNGDRPKVSPTGQEGMVATLPAPLSAEDIMPMVLAFLDDARYPPDPICDGSIERGGATIETGVSSWNDWPVRVRPCWRAFHK